MPSLLTKWRDKFHPLTPLRPPNCHAMEIKKSDAHILGTTKSGCYHGSTHMNSSYQYCDQGVLYGEAGESPSIARYTST